MGEPVLQLDQADHWELLYQELKVATELGGSRYTPIPPFTIPILASSPWLAIGTYSQQARSHWWLGCRVQFEISVPSSPFLFISAQQVNVPLNLFSLYKLQALQSSYRLKVQVPWWHRELGLTIYQYTGPASDSTEDLIVERTDVIRVDLARIETTVNDL
jgi:hypothetical protein